MCPLAQIWADADKYMEELEADAEFEALEQEQKKKAEAQKAGASLQPSEGATDPMQALEQAVGA